ncbi:MAG: hypothetical protein ACREJ2_09150 [Planctomycetota bacterium]
MTEPPRTQSAQAPSLPLAAPGVLMPYGFEGRRQHEAAFSTAEHWLQVTCALPAPADLDGHIWRAHVQLRERPDGELVVTSARRADRLDPLSLIAPSACQLPGVVAEFLSLAASIRTAPLRRCLSEVFTRRVVFENFWHVAAAPDHHHWRGGLAWHTLEVLRALDANSARRSEGAGSWSQAERDLAIVAAWLHDVAECEDGGEPASVAAEARRHTGTLRHHEFITEPLKNLGRADCALAEALLALGCPGPPVTAGPLRVDSIRQQLLRSHRMSETSTIRPLPDRYAVMFDRIVGITRH